MYLAFEILFSFRCDAPLKVLFAIQLRPTFQLSPWTCEGLFNFSTTPN